MPPSSQSKILGFVLASGLCASLASTFAKLAFSETLLALIPVESLYFEYALRGLCIAVLAGANTLMLHYYVKALNASTNTIVPTVLNTSVNVVVSAVMGHLVFQESMTEKKLFGTFLCLLGVYCIQKASPTDHAKSR